MHRYHARRAARAKPATGFVTQPEPRTIGHFARGRQLIAGNYLFAGTLTEAKDASIWEIDQSSPMVREELHGCNWLDDLAAVGDAKARASAQAWVNDWIDRYGTGTGPGWLPGLTGRRLIRWINHGIFLLRGQKKERSEAFFRSLGQQTLFLSRRWRVTPPGLPRFEALAGMIYAGLALEGMREHVAPAMRALAADCRTEIDADGGIATRNPEELLEVMTLLNWAIAAFAEAGQQPPPPVLDAIDRIAPTLRALRHADGSLARFHGGGRGLDGRLDHALATSNVKTPPGEGLHMGFARINAGRMSIIIDAARPPTGLFSANGHASTLAMELTSGRRPIIVNCGSGRSFGPEWRRAGRATPSHATLGIEGYSSSRLGQASGALSNGPEILVDTPTLVRCETSELPDGRRIELSHNGFQLTHGLTHARILDIAHDGRGIVGEDMLTTLSSDDQRRFDSALDQSKLQGIPYAVRFHLHPDVDATVDLGGTAVSLALKSGEIWVFRYDGIGRMDLKPSVYLENGRLKPRATRQVVLSGRAMSYATRVCWSLAKAQDTPDVVRDLAPR
ncbi:heparinase II/III family protein [Cognatiyoonia koreensis]|nr:heparinase II/III family protein [Cognatiyoonia koreensis]